MTFSVSPSGQCAQRPLCRPVLPRAEMGLLLGMAALLALACLGPVLSALVTLRNRRVPVMLRAPVSGQNRAHIVGGLRWLCA